MKRATPRATCARSSVVRGSCSTPSSSSPRLAAAAPARAAKWESAPHPRRVPDARAGRGAPGQRCWPARIPRSRLRRARSPSAPPWPHGWTAPNTSTSGDPRRCATTAGRRTRSVAAFRPRHAAAGDHRREVQAFSDALARAGHYSARTRQKALVLLGRIFKVAQIEHDHPTNPVTLVSKGTVPAGEVVYFTHAEVALIAEQADPEDADLFTVMSRIGHRRGEIVAVRWRNVDFDGQQVHVRRNYVEGQVDTPKDREIRTVPLQADAAEILARRSLREHFTGPDDLVFATVTGEYLNPDNLSKRFTRGQGGSRAGTAARDARESPAYVRDLRRRHARGHAPGRAALARALRPQDDHALHRRARQARRRRAADRAHPRRAPARAPMHRACTNHIKSLQRSATERHRFGSREPNRSVSGRLLIRRSLVRIQPGALSRGSIRAKHSGCVRLATRAVLLRSLSTVVHGS